jgi:hypothetical protein
MKVEFIFRHKGQTLNVAEIQAYVNQKLGEFPIKGSCESVTQMSKWLAILVDFPELKAHSRSYHEPIELWWEVLAGYVALQFDVRFLHWEVHGETRSLIYHMEWERKRYM